MHLKFIPEDDIEDLIRLAQDFHQESPYAFQEFSYDKALDIFTAFIRAPREERLVLGLYNGLLLVGFIIGLRNECLFNTDYQAAELAWYVSPDYRKGRWPLRLREAYEYWGRKVGCKTATICLLANDYADRLDRYYDSQGFVKYEQAYMKVFHARN